MILHVEDNVCDALLLKLALDRARLPVEIHNVTSARAALQYMAGVGHYSDRQHWPLPEMILLDLKLPAMGGFDVLSTLRQHDEFRSLPIIVLTSYRSDDDRKLARELGAVACLEKTADYRELVVLVRTLLGAAPPDPESARILALGRTCASAGRTDIVPLS
jgi:CheY-like chemotaxis protein